MTTTLPVDTTEQPPRNSRRTASLTGWLMVTTFITSIPAYFFFYAPLREDPASISGSGVDPTSSVAMGALLELVLIVANVGTAVVPYAIFRRYSEGLALGYVGARLVEAFFIAVGLLSALTFIVMRQDGTAVADPDLGLVLAAVHDRAFMVGPGIFAGVANGIILGLLMYRSGLVPRGLAVVGLVGGPLVVLSGVAVMFDVIDRGGTVQGLATIPEFVWELSFGVYLIVKGFKASPTSARGSR